MDQTYLIDIPGRESEAVRRLLPAHRLAEIFSGSSLHPPFAWYLLELEMNRLCDLEGDVDILAGDLSWRDPSLFQSIAAEEAKTKPDYHPSWHFDIAAHRLAADGGLTWPPSLHYLVGVEAKCAYLSRDANWISEDKIKAKKSAGGNIKRLHIQIEKLRNMGFNKVALLDMIATPPAPGNGIHAWFATAIAGDECHRAMGSTLNERLPPGSAVGHWVCSIGAVIGGDESRRGAILLRQLQQAEENPHIQKVEIAQRRKTVENNLRHIFEDLPPAMSFPVIFVNCKSCRRIHGLPVCSSR